MGTTAHCPNIAIFSYRSTEAGKLIERYDPASTWARVPVVSPDDGA